MSASPTATATRNATVRSEVYKPPTASVPYYCPTSPSKDQHQQQNQRRMIVDDETIDPQLRSISEGSSSDSSASANAGGAATSLSRSLSAAGISTTLVPAHFPSADDDPHDEDDLEDTSNMRTPRPKRTRQRVGVGVGANGVGGEAEAGAHTHRRQNSRQSFNDSENPFAPPADAQEERVDGRPFFNRELYPGYDEFGNRRGLEHLRGGAHPPIAGSYYRPRAHHYDATQIQIQPGVGSGVAGPGRSALVVPPAVDYTMIHQQNAVNGTSAVAVAVNPALLTPAPGPGPTFPSGRERTIHEILGLKPGTPISLDSLADPEPGQKPEYTYATLVKLAIYSSPQKKLTLQEIYEAIERRFSWFKNCENPNAWKTSIRHSLSLLAAFQKVPRHVTDPGKGHYWTVDFSKGEGNKRVRKRNKKPPKGSAAKKKSTEDDSRANSQRSHTQDTSQSTQEEMLESELEMSDSDEYIDPALKQLSSSTGSRPSPGKNASNIRPGLSTSRSVTRVSLHAPSASHPAHRVSAPVTNEGISLSASLRKSMRAAGRKEPYPRPPSSTSTASSLSLSAPGPCRPYYRDRRALPARELDEDYDYDELETVETASVRSASLGASMNLDYDRDSNMLDADIRKDVESVAERDATISVSSSMSERSVSTPPTDGHGLSDQTDGPIPLPGRPFGRPIFGASYGPGIPSSLQTLATPPTNPTFRTSLSAASTSHTLANANGVPSTNGRTARSSSSTLSSSLPPSSNAPSGFLSHASRAVSFTSVAGTSGSGRSSEPMFGKNREKDDIVMIDAGGLPAARRVSPRKRAGN